MLISCTDTLIRKTAKQALSSLLLTLLTVSSIVNGHAVTRPREPSPRRDRRTRLEKLPPNESEQNELAIRVGEDGMRKSASRTVMPSYPAEALKKRQQGVAVVELEYDAKGDVVSTSILEAPSRSIADAVVSAVRQWKFVPSKKQDGTPVSIRGKLTFYFEIDKEGNGEVQNPKQYR